MLYNKNKARNGCKQKKVTLNIMKNFYKYLYFTIYKVIYIIYLYFYRRKIVEVLFCVLSRFVTLSSDLSLVLSFLSGFDTFTRVLKAHFKVTSKVRPRPDGTNCCCCYYHSRSRNRTRLHSYQHCNGLRVRRKEGSCQER